MNNNRLLPEEKWIVLGIPVLFFIGAFIHFLYDLSGQNAIVALIAPVNESAWEHLKMVVVPLVCWWTFYYIIKGQKNSINIDKWFTSALIALLVSLISIPLMFYFYTEAFGFDSVILDILLLLFALIIGQLKGLHYYRYGKGINYIVSIAIMLLIVCIFMIFTYNPPHLPIFLDRSTGTYGIGHNQ